MDILRKFDIPCAPVLTMKEIANDPSLRESGTIVEVDHKQRGKYLTVGSPIKFSDMTVEITGSPLLGEHTDEVLADLGYTPSRSRPCTRPARSDWRIRPTGSMDPAVPRSARRSRRAFSSGRSDRADRPVSDPVRPRRRVFRAGTGLPAA